MKITTQMSMILFLVLLMSCSQNNSEPSEVKKLRLELKQAKNQLETLKEDARTEKNNSVENLETYGSFSLNDNKLHVSIPVASTDYEISEDPKNVSTDNYNALLIRVSDNTTNSIDGLPARHTILAEYDLDRLQFDLNELEADNKLLIYTLNSIDSIKAEDLDSLKNCVEKLNSYHPSACVDSFRKDRNKRPNDKKGSVVYGIVK